MLNKKQNTKDIIAQVKSLLNGVNASEKEIVRDELLAFLLFGDQLKTGLSTGSENFKGLTESEKALIKKLAEQTEALYKAHRINGKK